MNKFTQTAGLAFLSIFTVTPAAFASEALVEANKLYEQKDYDDAVVAFRAIIVTERDLPTKAKAIFNLGLTFKQLERYDDAIEVFHELLGQPVDDHEPGGHIMEIYRNYRPRAQWEIGNCHFDQGQYEEALQAYRETKEKHRFQSWCGNCQEYAEHRCAYQVGLCHEYKVRGALPDAANP